MRARLFEKQIARFHSWLRSLVRREQLAAEMDGEIGFHLEARAADFRPQGLSTPEAKRQARVEFGAVATHRDGDARLARSTLVGRVVGRPSLCVARSAQESRLHRNRHPLACARDGANTTIFSVANALLYKQLGVPHQDSMGKRFSTGNGKDRKWIEIIGVCGNTRYDSLRNPPPPLHVDPYRQQDTADTLTYIVRTRNRPEAIVPSPRAAVQRIDHDLPLMDIRSQEEQIDAGLQQERMFAALTSGLGMLALALACVGIYGILAYTVAQRTNEIGIRLAFGAERGEVRRLVLREATWLALSGVAAGLLIALCLGRLVKSLLYGLQPADLISLAAAALLLLTVALVAGWIPAIRASNVEPMEALRHE